jgi:hypothetical protein
MIEQIPNFTMYRRRRPFAARPINNANIKSAKKKTLNKDTTKTTIY